MQELFTVHSVPWQVGAQLFREVRAVAYELNLQSIAELLTDEMDEHSRHALALNESGRAIGCARITPDGTIQRMLVLPVARRTQIEAAMIEVLNDYRGQVNSRVGNISRSRNKPHAVRMLA